MSGIVSWSRRQLAGLLALVVLVGLYFAVRLPEASADERRSLAEAYRFASLSVPMPGGLPQRTIRDVNRDYTHLRAWISSVGAGVALNDLDGDGLANDMCVTDPRIDSVVVTPAPVAGGDRYQPFVLDPAPLPMSPYIAPMGCLPGDFNEDGRTDLLVYWWGRTPVLFLAKAGTAGLSRQTYQPTELVASAPGPEGYAGPKWNTNTASVADLDGDGHDDLYLGNYFPDGPVLDDRVKGGVAMNRSMSAAVNGGDDHIMRWTAATTGAAPTATYTEARNVLPEKVSRGWALAMAANDLDGDLLPEIYLAHDFGADRLLHNRSTAGHIAFSLVEAAGTPALVPKSKRVGHDSFKGMGVDFGDLDHDGLYDIYVGNITTSFGIQESNLAFVNRASDQADLRRSLLDGDAPWDDRSTDLGLAWSGWSWDVKFGDFDNSGEPAIVQTAGFVKGTVNRWAQLQEVATSNDDLLAHPFWWANVEQGDDIAGGHHLAFHARRADGSYEDLSPELGLADPVPSRGIATADVDGDGRLDLAVARQWDAPVFYRNESPATGGFLHLRLLHEQNGAAAGDPLAGAGSPVVGAQVKVTTAAGKVLIGRVDGGSGHSGRRSAEVTFGLGPETGPVTAALTWRDRAGGVHEQELTLDPGRHTVVLGSQAQEVNS